MEQCWHDAVEATLGGDDWCSNCGAIAVSLFDDGQVAVWRQPALAGSSYDDLRGEEESKQDESR